MKLLKGRKITVYTSALVFLIIIAIIGWNHDVNAGLQMSGTNIPAVSVNAANPALSEIARGIPMGGGYKFPTSYWIRGLLLIYSLLVLKYFHPMHKS
jgi:hypothetical protein